MSNFNQTLYKRHTNGTIGSWQVEVYGHETSDLAIIRRTATKILGGKPVITDTEITKGKNIGKANETTPLEQANLEAESKYNKKLDEGYVKTLEEAQVKATNSMGLVKPMLAQPIEKVKQWDFPVFASPKLDGHRMLATVQDGEVMLYSRGGKPIDVEHIRSTLQNDYDLGAWNGETLDGEIYIHGETLQTISSLVKKPKPESIKLVYCLYDLVSNVPYSHRMLALDFLNECQDSDCLSLVPQMLIYTQAELDEYHSENLSNGYEGTMVRHGDFGYEDGKRSKSLMKMKDFQDAEFEIIAAFEGKPNVRNNLKVGMYKCQTKEGKRFDVLAPGDMYEKHAHAMEGENNIGSYMTVKFFNMTPDGVPFLPVALRIREDI